MLVQTGIRWYHKGDMRCVPPAESVCGVSVSSHVPLTLEKRSQIDHTPPRVLGESSQSVRSKVACDPKATLNVPVWSQITASPDIKNRHAISHVKATLGTTARRTLRTWVKSGVFHNTMDKTLQIGITGAH